MKKTMLAAAVALAVIAFCGCSSSGTSATNASESSTSTATMQQSTTTETSGTSEASADAGTVAPSDDYDLNEYSMDGTLGSGYSYEATLKIGSWVKATDTEAVNGAWQAVGGKGSLPDISQFRDNAYATVSYFEENTSVYVFGTVSVVDTTDGGFSIADSSQALNVTVTSPEIKNSFKQFDGFVQYDDGDLKYTHNAENAKSSMVHVKPDMTSKNWGPVPFAVCVSDVLSPANPDGDPSILNAEWVFGKNSFNVFPTWMDTSRYSSDGALASFCGTWEGDNGSEIEFFENGDATLVRFNGEKVNAGGDWQVDMTDEILSVDFPDFVEDGWIDLSDGYRSTSFTIEYDEDEDEDGGSIVTERFTKKQ